MRLKQLSETQVLAVVNANQYIIEDGKPVIRGFESTETVDNLPDADSSIFIVSAVNNAIATPTNIVTDLNELNVLANFLDHLNVSFGA